MLLLERKDRICVISNKHERDHTLPKRHTFG